VESHLGSTLREVLPKLAPTIEPLFQRVLDNGESFLGLELSGEIPVEPGGLRHWLISYFPLSGPDGEARTMGGVIVDITERKRMEEELRKHRDHLEELVHDRTAELRKAINLMAGREVRMADLKGVIRELRAQLEEAGLRPVASDRFLGSGS